MQKVFMTMLVVLMAGFVTSCGDDDKNDGFLGNYTITLRVSEQGTLSDETYTALNTLLKTKEVNIPNVLELAAKTAFEESFRAFKPSFLDVTSNYTLEYALKNSSGKTIAVHYINVKDGKISYL